MPRSQHLIGHWGRDSRASVDGRVGYRAAVLLSVVAIVVAGSPESPHSDEGVIALSGALVLIVGWVVAGVVLFRRARRRQQRRDTLPPKT